MLFALLGLWIFSVQSWGQIPGAPPSNQPATAWCMPYPERAGVTVYCLKADGNYWESSYARRGEMVNGVRGPTEWAPSVLIPELDNRIEVAFSTGAPLMLSCAWRPGEVATPNAPCPHFDNVAVGTHRFIPCQIHSRREGGGAVFGLLTCRNPREPASEGEVPVGMSGFPGIRTFAYPTGDRPANRTNPVVQALMGTGIAWQPPVSEPHSYRSRYEATYGDVHANVVLEVDFGRISATNASFGCIGRCRTIVRIHPAEHPVHVGTLSSAPQPR